MTLRTRTRLIIAIALIGLLAGLYAATSTIVLNGFAELEQANTRQNVERVLDALDNELASLNSKAGDWANWDDSYNFVQDRNSSFASSNLGIKSFVELQVNLILFVDSSGETVFAKAIDLERGAEIPVPDFSAYLQPDSVLTHHADTASAVTGLVGTPTPMLVASRPILTSEGGGPIRGTLIFARYLDDTQIKRLADVTHLSLSFYQFGTPAVTDDLRRAQASLTPQAGEPAPIPVQALDGNVIAGYTRLSDVLDQPVLLLRAEMPRSIYAQGQTSMHYFIGALSLVVAVFGAITWYALDRMVISQHISREMEERYRSVIATSPDAIGLTTLGGTWMMVNPQTVQLFGAASPDQFTERNIIGSVAPDRQEQLIADLKRARGGDVIRQAEYPLHRMDGTLLPAELSLALVSDEDKRPSAFIVILRDISDRKRTEQIRRDKIFTPSVDSRARTRPAS